MSLEKNYTIKIINTKNNTFITLNNTYGQLLSYKSLKEKKTKDMKVKLTWGLINLFKKIRDLKIKYINLNLNNLDNDLLQHIFVIFTTWNITINYITYAIPIPHNGCRRSHKSRKRNKGKKKNKDIILGL